MGVRVPDRVHSTEKDILDKFARSVQLSVLDGSLLGTQGAVRRLLACSKLSPLTFNEPRLVTLRRDLA